MRVTLDDMKRVVKMTIKEERAVDAFKNEIKRVLGPSVVTEGKVDQVAESANDRITVLERTGRAGTLVFKPSVMVPFLTHSNPEVRRLAARTVPERFLSKVSDDPSHGVRLAAARRLPPNAVSEMLKRHPGDDELRVIYKKKRMNEEGVPKPKVVDEPFDMYGEERLGDAVKQDEGEDDLSEQWYKTQAFKLIQDYGRNIEDGWEEMTAHRYASSLRATSGVVVDEIKLLEAIKDMLEDRDDRVMDRSALKETIEWLKAQDTRERMQEAVMPIIDIDIDPVRALFESKVGSEQYLKEANDLFSIRESVVPSSIRKHRLGDENRRNVNVPVLGELPHMSGFRSIDEKALDRYCESWNTRQAFEGEPMKLSWSTHPSREGKVSFSVILK